MGRNWESPRQKLTLPVGRSRISENRMHIAQFLNHSFLESFQIRLFASIDFSCEVILRQTLPRLNIGVERDSECCKLWIMTLHPMRDSPLRLSVILPVIFPVVPPANIPIKMMKAAILNKRFKMILPFSSQFHHQCGLEYLPLGHLKGSYNQIGFGFLYH